jgi:hypothetical protein
MLTYDPVANLTHWPMPMARFGLNPHGQPRYRIVLADSRRYLVCGEWPDGSNCAQWTVKHKNYLGYWILEQWKPAEYFCPGGKEVWDREYLTLGPWPVNGDYEFQHVFLEEPPSESLVEKLIAMARYGHENVSLSQLQRYHRDLAEKEQTQNRTIAEEMIRNKLPAFGSRPMSGRGGGRGTKNYQFLRTAEELGLPTQPGLRTLPNQQAA